MGHPSVSKRPRAALAFREFALIVVGVLVALALESAWQDRAERAAERELLSGLLAEFARNAESLDRWIGFHQEISTAAKDLAGYLDRSPDGQTVSVPDSLIALLAPTPTYDPEVNSLDAALSSGQISIIRSADVQRALANWTRLLGDAQEEEGRSATQAHRELFPLLGAATRFGPAFSWVVKDVGDSMSGRARGPKPSTSSDVVASRALANALWVRHMHSEGAANELGLLKIGLMEAIALLEGES